MQTTSSTRASRVCDVTDGTVIKPEIALHGLNEHVRERVRAQLRANDESWNERLAEVGGISVRQVYDFLAGRRGTSLDAIDKFAVALRQCPLSLLSSTAPCSRGPDASHDRLRHRLAHHLRRFRGAFGCLSVDTWARTMGLSTSSLYSILAAESNPRLETIETILAKLDTTVIELLGCSSNPSNVRSTLWR